MNYFDWLCMWAIPDGIKRETYRELLLALYNFDFYWSIRNDENRANDGLELRNVFEEETGEGCDKSGPCSLLEMFLGLAVRCNNEFMYNPEDPKRADIWFWMMMENLGLDKISAENAEKWLKMDKNGYFMDSFENIFIHFCDRNYGQNGQFCAFPYTKNSHKLAKTELFYHMGYYLKENFHDFW